MKMPATAAILLALAAPALAAPPSGHGPMMADDRSSMGMMRGMCPMGMGRHTEGALAFLKTELKITPAQTAAWDAFAAAYRDSKGHGGQMPMMPGGMMNGGKALPMPERMAQHAKMMEGHLAQLKKMQGSVSQLYASLTTEQKRMADELLPMFMMHRMM
jgi:LTXXQ motif family protein